MLWIALSLFAPQMHPKNVSTKRVARRTFLTQATAPEGRSRNEVSAESIWAFLKKVCAVTVYSLAQNYAEWHPDTTGAAAQFWYWQH